MGENQVSLTTAVRYLKGVGPKMSQKLKKLEIETINDLIYYLPSYYKNFSLINKIGLAQPGEILTIKGRIKEFRNQYTKKGKNIQKVILEDESGQIQLIWFGQPFLRKTLKVNSQIACSGKIEIWNGAKAMISPEYETNLQEMIHTGRLVPVYPETKGVSSKYLRKIVKQCLKLIINKIEEPLPSFIIQKYQLMPKKTAILNIHFPRDLVTAQKAKERLAFEEMFLIQLKILQKKLNWQTSKIAPQLMTKKNKIQQMIKKLPFQLTNDQKKAIQEILQDLEKQSPSNRLLQGDVGSGKTIVAAIAAYNSYLNGWQTALMAPTEILAWQHFQNFKKLLSPLGVKIMLLTSKKKVKTFKDSSLPNLIIGTHSLIHKRANFQNLGLVIIDEQHRFGVAQRALLVYKGVKKNQFFPHLLTMTATPIPRTVNLTINGDLDLSLITELPKGRQRIATFVVPNYKRQAAYQWIENQIKKNHTQAFIICPLIENSDSETLKNVKAAKAEFKRLKKIVFPKLKLALLHGKLKTQEKEKILKKMQKREIDILVATPVVEVGIDIPQATIMVIEAAERFGLAQLHQLRGRVGRGNRKSFCLLFSESRNSKIINRLKTLEKIYQGIKLAEIDLKLRGPGEIYGLRQHGFPKLKAASLLDLPLIQKTRKEAAKILSQNPNLNHYPILKEIVSGKKNLTLPN